ncbi:MAG: NUDIX domain-containing protein [bacterium]|nr:NUDIX domain-containing protein [bacterium]
MSEERFMVRIAVHLILLKDGKVLLMRRKNTGWEDGNYGLAGGHVDGRETVTDAMVREAKEETGISIARENLRVVHTMHRMSTNNIEYMDVYFTASAWKGEPGIAEPDKCDDIKWFPLAELPANILSYDRQAMEYIGKGVAFSEVGWGKTG